MPLPPRSIAAVDSGPLIALYDRRDRHHERVRTLLRDHPGLVLVSVWPVLAEACAVLFHHVHKQAELDLLAWVDAGALTGIRRRMTRYRDLPLDFADASLAELLEQERLDTVLPLDADFDIYRGPSRRRFKNPLSP